jgi:thiamine-monophosphate kinase
MIDLSDGLSTDLRHICEESGVGAEVWESAVPHATVGSPARKVDSRFALHGGEDYELLFTASNRSVVPAHIDNVRITEVGLVTRNSRQVLLHSRGSAREFVPRGWEHFRAKT